MVSPSSRLSRHRALAVASLVILLIAGWAFTRLGTFFEHEDPLQPADAIMVLAGSRIERTLEAADLYREGQAPVIVLNDWLPEGAILVVRQRGLPFDSDTVQQRALLIRSGVPASAVLVPARVHDNTAQEAQTLRALARERKWRRVIVVSAKYHLRRAGFAVRRELEGSGVEVVMRGTKYDTSDPARWWAHRSDIRWILGEMPKLAAYLLGLGA